MSELARGSTCAVSAMTVDITPMRSLPLSGFSGRTGIFTSVRDRLEANILCLYPLAGPPTYLVSVDALYGGVLAPRLLVRLKLLPEQLVVAGSHTHFAPGIDPALPVLGATDIGYVDQAVEAIAGAIGNRPEPKPGYIGYGVGITRGLFVNRRRPVLGRGVSVPKVGASVSAPHAKGPVDARSRVALVTSEERAVAVLWGVSCHPVCSPTPTAVSACFPGEVRSAIRRARGERLPVLFVQGFSGDIRPCSTSRRPPRSLRSLAQFALAGGRRFVEQTEAEYRDWCDRLSCSVLTAVPRQRAEFERMLGAATRFQHATPSGWERAPHIQRIQLSSKLDLVAVNAEVVCERIASLEAMFGDRQVIPVGCCNEVLGYWPTNRMRKQGGYEAGGAACCFPPLDWDAAGGPDHLWAATIRGVSSVPSE